MLYKATATVTVYFMSEETREGRLMREADDYIREELSHNGTDELPVLTKITKVETPAGNWELASFVPGSEEFTGDEPLSLKDAMEFAADQTDAPNGKTLTH